ncbi:MAG: hypothetical protein MR443_02795 [Lachnospiraceae bacterium]|nr:hypothetical protein [Lachnospiraceae bacterium]
MITDTKANTHNHKSTNHGLTQDASFSQQELEEDLLETLYGWWKEGRSVETTQLCLSMNISQQKLHTLADQMVAHGYLEKRDNWESMKLTPYGKDQGAECLERHQYLTQFLQMICGLDKEQAEENACRMEHVVDTDVMHGIRDYLKYGDHYDRMIKNLNLLTLYKEGSYWFRGEIYDTNQRYPRILAQEDRLYEENILLEVHENRSFIYLQTKECQNTAATLSASDRTTRTSHAATLTPDSEQHSPLPNLWYLQNGTWKLAEDTAKGIQIPADSFEFTIGATDIIREGTLMIGFTDAIRLPEEEDCRELNIHIW